jgi:hypothetical protein
MIGNVQQKIALKSTICIYNNIFSIWAFFSFAKNTQTESKEQQKNFKQIIRQNNFIMSVCSVAKHG